MGGREGAACRVLTAYVTAPPDKAQLVADGRTVAVKRQPLGTNESVPTREVTILEMLPEHPNIIGLVTALFDAPPDPASFETRQLRPAMRWDGRGGCCGERG